MEEDVRQRGVKPGQLVARDDDALGSHPSPCGLKLVGRQ